MQVELDVNKTIDQNASVYFEKAKKLKKKIDGIKKTIAEHERLLLKEQEKEEKKAIIKKTRQQKEWYEKFRWFYSSDGFFVLAGRDATTNEILIKKHTEKNDIVFHADAPGSPFVIIKTSVKVPQTTLQEAAEYCVSLSNAWKRGLSAAEVYWITPEQVSKEAKSGEYLKKGAFMIYGKRNYMIPKMNLAICNYQEKISVFPVSAAKKHTDKYVLLVQGNKKLSEIAKKIQKKIGGEIDDIVRALPQGVDIA
ncbi:DUF814 domain-containing protein [Candidatus Woesearchaeota archaeon]|nr:MAG: DUF814 domain-containing protein [Candidatus Woesearchaeota archaeon]